MIPTQNQLLFPLLETIQDMGGKASTGDLCRRLAERMEVSGEDRKATVDVESHKRVNLWERQVRWTQQLAKLRSLACRDGETWKLTEKGEGKLQNAQPGVVVTVFESEAGVVLWSEAEAAVHTIEGESVSAIITSPPYPLLRKKDYANQLPEREHVEWLASVFAAAKPKLRHDGSLVLNLGPVWQKGRPTMSLYGERLLIKLCDDLGYHLASKLYWHNPSKMPSPAEWVTVRRIRVTAAVEEIFWLSKQPFPKANNRNVLRPYSDRMKQLLASQGEKAQLRPSGHALRKGAFQKDCGGSIAHNLITAPNTASNDAYQRYCRSRGLPIHPARFPVALPDFFIRFLTDPGDIVWDMFGGSLGVAESAQKLDRKFIVNEKSLVYCQGGIGGRLT
jgi:DNA modification methylase